MEQVGPFLKRTVRLLLCIGFFCHAAGCRQQDSIDIEAVDLLQQAKTALASKDFEQTILIVDSIPTESPDWQAAQLLAGEAATKNGQLEQALEYYSYAAAHDEESQEGLLAIFSAAEIYLELGQLSAAEEFYRRVFAKNPENALTNERMAFLLSISGRRWEALDHYFVLIKSGTATYRELALAADVGRQVEQLEFLEKCKRLTPDDRIVRLCLANYAFAEGLPTARQQLEEFVNEYPGFISAQALLGELYLDDTDESSFLRWHQGLPHHASDSPDIWFIRGLWARGQSELNIAADCFEQALVRTPFHRRAMYSLGQTLSAIESPRSANVLAYSESLIELSQAIDQVLVSEGNNEIAVRNCAMTLEKLGRIWEACAWGLVGKQHFTNPIWATELLSKYGSALNEQLPRVQESANPIHSQQLASLKAFDAFVARSESTLPLEKMMKPAGKQSEECPIEFQELPLIDFQYYNADDPTTKGLRTFEQTGGGVAIIDYDVDGFPDVFLPQGTEWKTGSAAPTPSGDYVDQLNRNIDGKLFQDVSRHLSISESGYGQGATVGDFNNDGFPDLYVANVGENTLYENMGDGTFIDVTEHAGLSDQSWTVSTMINDLNADGQPDIYDVNYLSGNRVYQKICQGRVCSPGSFPGAADRIHLSQGDGTFVTVPTPGDATDSKGLGIVSFVMAYDQRPSIFIANDQVANHFFKSLAAANEYNFKLSNEALITGLAFNEDGLSMACMGVAAADFNGDSQLDIFVTNFLNESNTLYLQESSGLFLDATKERGLQANSLEFTSWGTQPIDADLDGDFDLVVVSGHVDDYSDEGGPYRMRSQFFENVDGQFQERMPDEVGRWFGEKRLGRGLATLDWNRDGLKDFIVSNVNAPVSVMSNQTELSNNYVEVLLSASATARDAIGAEVSLMFGSEVYKQQLIAGHGYMASNERVLSFGVGDHKKVDQLIVHWPSGAESIIESPPVQARLIVVEKLRLATCIVGKQAFSKAVTYYGSPEK